MYEFTPSDKKLIRSGDRWMNVLGGLFLVAAVGLAGRTLWRLATYERATGQVQLDGAGSKKMGSYKISFPAKDGAGATIESFSVFGYEDGETVTVRYPASDPAAGVVSNFVNLWFWPLLCAILGIRFVGFLPAMTPTISERPAPPADPMAGERTTRAPKRRVVDKPPDRA